MYSDIHRLFLQTCSSNGSLEESKAIKILEKIMIKFEQEDTTCNEEILTNVIEEINSKISFIHQKIIKTNHEMLPENLIVFINTEEDPLNKNQIYYTEAHRNYFALLLKEIVLNDDNCLGMLVATNLSKEIKEIKLTKQCATELVKNWTKIGYFLESDDKIFLGPKGIAEFGVYLKIHYKENVENCSICSSGVFYGLKCGNDNDCNALYHRKCIKIRLRKLNDCSNCKLPWITSIK